MAVLEVENIRKAYGKTPVLKGIGFSLEKGEVLSVIGSSGSGKTTLLRCLNFLETPETGVIRVNGETLLDTADPATLGQKAIRQKRLHFGLVFQQFNLFPQYTVKENVMLAKTLLAKESLKKPASLRAGPPCGTCWMPSTGRRTPCWTGWAWPPRRTATPAACPAASSSGPPLPGRWP